MGFQNGQLPGGGHQQDPKSLEVMFNPFVAVADDVWVAKSIDIVEQVMRERLLEGLRSGWIGHFVGRRVSWAVN